MPGTAPPKGTDERVECPLCAGRGTVRGRTFTKGTPLAFACGLCHGHGSIAQWQIEGLNSLRHEMERVANLMQAGDADGAAARVRIAVRIARGLSK